MTKLGDILKGLVWESPRSLPRARWEERLAPCTQRPDTWARVHTIKKATVARATVTALKKRRLQIPNPEGGWLFTTESLPSGEWGIYACYLGPASGKRNAD